MLAQDALTASLGTLLEVHNVSMPPPEAHRRLHSPRQQLGLERFGNLRAVTVNEAHHVRDCRLPALPVSVRTLNLDAGRGTLRCRPMPDGIASKQHVSCGTGACLVKGAACRPCL